MPERDIVTWNVLTSCCVRNNRTRDAFVLFNTMMQSESNGCEADCVTCLHLLQACAHLNALEFGEKKSMSTLTSMVMVMLSICLILL